MERKSINTGGRSNVKHESAGGFVFHKSNQGRLFVALIQKRDGRMLVPKGHIEPRETPKQAAIREIGEEMNLKQGLKLVKKIGTTAYSFKMPNDERLHRKKVHLFLFESTQKPELKPLLAEGFVRASWVPYDIALKKLTFDAPNLVKGKQIFDKKS